MKIKTVILVLTISVNLLFSCPVFAGWDITTVDSQGYVHFPSIAIDSYDRPNIAYSNSWTYEVDYASYTGSSWIIDTVDYAQPNGMRYTSLALDSSDRPHIGYKSDQNFNITYAFNNPWNSFISLNLSCCKHYQQRT